METDKFTDRATDILDSVLPRRDPRYDGAHTYLTIYLGTDAATRRLCMRALRDSSPAPEHDQAASLPAAGGAPESGGIHDGAAAPRAEEGASTEPATVKPPSGADVATKAFATRPDSPGQPRLSCGGTRCHAGLNGIEVHDANDPTCTFLRKPKRARA